MAWEKKDLSQINLIFQTHNPKILTKSRSIKYRWMKLIKKVSIKKN